MIVEYLGFQIKPSREVPTNHIVVTAGKGGSVPDVLNGLYTHPNVAKKAIDEYLASKAQKEEDNAKTRTKSGS